MSTCTGWLRVSLKLCNVGCMILAFVCGCLAGCYCQLTYAAYEQLGVVRSIDTEIAESALDRTITSGMLFAQ